MSDAGPGVSMRPIDKADDGGNHMIMDDTRARIAGLAQDLSALKTDVAVIRANHVTKADLAGLEVTLLRWWIGSVVTLTGVVVGAAKFIH